MIYIFHEMKLSSRRLIILNLNMQAAEQAKASAEGTAEAAKNATGLNK